MPATGGSPTCARPSTASSSTRSTRGCSGDTWSARRTPWSTHSTTDRPPPREAGQDGGSTLALRPRSGISLMSQNADVVIVGAGLAGLVAAAELLDAGKRVIILEQEPAASFGGQAWWAFGGLFLVDSPEQRRMGIRDSHELARQDWLG